MASYSLEAFEKVENIALVAAVEDISATRINIAFWVTDPYQQIIYPESLAQAERRDYLWEQTCFEIFLGIQQQDAYREVNLATSGAWQIYQFEEYRYPDTMPPAYAQDVEIVQFQRTKYGLNVVLDLKHWLLVNKVKLNEVYLGLTAVIQTKSQNYHFAMQHSTQNADFHNKRDWLHSF